MEPIDAGLMRRRLAAAAASERASLELLTDRDLPESILDGLSSALTMRNRAPGWIHSPEVDLLNFDCDMPAPELIKLARARSAARMERQRIRRARYMRRHGQSQQSWPYKGQFGNLSSMGGITGTRPRVIILDDPHAEMPTDAQRATIEAWYEKPIARHPPH